MSHIVDAAVHQQWYTTMRQNKHGGGKRKKKTAIAFDSSKWKHYFELILSKLNIVFCCALDAGDNTLSMSY